MLSFDSNIRFVYFLNKAAKIVFKNARYKTGDSTRKLSHSWQAKSRQDLEKLFKMFKITKIRGPRDGKKKTLLNLLSNAKLVSNL